MKIELAWQGRIFEDGKPYFPVEVPGNIQYDWAVSEGFADSIMVGTTAKRFLSVEDVTWEYRTELNYEEKPGQTLWFVAEGIDYIFDILLDGILLYSHEGMYTKTELDLSGRAHPGSLLQVIVHPHPKLTSAPANRVQASQSVKPPSPYGWDWNPRLLISGIWKPAYLEYRGVGYIRRCEPFYTLDAERKNAAVRFETECDKPVHYTVCDREGKIVYSGDKNEFTLSDVNLWWCNGQGDPYLYTWTATSPDDQRTGKIGFRTVRLVKNLGGAEFDPPTFPKSRCHVPITVELNGRRIFAKGSNWVNPELFFGRITKETYRNLLTAARDANMNILRLWGGSGIKKPEFYEICDELGIMLWQEFILACNNYVGTLPFLRVLEQEATSIIKELRRHPSLILWCGGNELFNTWSGMNDQSHALRLLNKLCYELDFERPFIATSPLEGMKHGFYVFEDDVEQVYTMFRHAHGTAYSEFGVSSTCSLESLKKIIPEDEQFPIEKTESWIYHHAFGAWGDERWLCLDLIRKYFGEPQSLEDVVNASNLLQSEGYKAIFEEARRQWPFCSMALNWCYNEPWQTAANNSIIEYPCRKKPAYYAVKDSLRPVLASARLDKINYTVGETFTAELWLLNDSDEAVSDTIRAEIELGGIRYPIGEWKTENVEPRTNAQGEKVSFVLPETTCRDFSLHLLAREGRESEYRFIIR